MNGVIFRSVHSLDAISDNLQYKYVIKVTENKSKLQANKFIVNEKLGLSVD